MASKVGSIGSQAFFIRGGQNWGHRSFFPVHTEDLAEEEVLESFMAQFYEEVPAPRLILADRVPLEAELLTQALSERTGAKVRIDVPQRSEEHTSELQSLMRISYAVFCLKKKKNYINTTLPQNTTHIKYT